MALACAALRAADNALAGGHICEGAAPADESAQGDAVGGSAPERRRSRVCHVAEAAASGLPRHAWVGRGWKFHSGERARIGSTKT